MHILIDGKNLCQPLSGIGRYVFNHINGLAALGNQISLIVPKKIDSAYKLAHKINVIRPGGQMILNAPVVWHAHTVKQLVNRIKPDLFWGPAHRLPIFSISVPSAVTIHDLTWLRIPSSMRFRGYVGERLFMARSIKKANHIITISQTVRQEILSEFCIDKAKITAIHNASSLPVTNSTKREVKEPYFLSVGTIEPRKNYVRLVEAFEIFIKRHNTNHRLIIAGGKGWGLKSLRKCILNSEIADRVDLIFGPSDENLGHLYYGAFAIIQPSLYEGFGIPVIEAIGFGKPVLLSNIGAHQEILGSVGVYFSPTSLSEIVDSIEKTICPNFRLEETSYLARRKFLDYDWLRASKQLNNVFESMVLSS